MPSGNSIFKELEPEVEVPDYLKQALVSEVDIIRNTMTVVNHFSEHFISAMVTSLSMLDKE